MKKRGLPVIGDIKDAVATHRSDVTISLTPIGKRKAEQFTLEGPKFDVLAALLEHGASTLGELATETGMGTSKVAEVAKSLIRNGYVKKVS